MIYNCCRDGFCKTLCVSYWNRFEVLVVKYFRIVDDQGNLISRIPYDRQIPAFANSSINLNGVIPSQYLK